MVFYAYLKNSQDDATYRYLLTFADREAADEWWRMISTFPSPYVGHVKRISPQFYTQNIHEINIAKTFFAKSEPPDTKQFLDKMFFTLLHDGGSRVLSTIPPIAVTDHISGKWYFIRSNDDSRRHWYFRIDGPCLVCGEDDCDAIHVSTEYRTRFCMRARNVAYKGPQTSQDLVLIGRDEISIAASKDYILHIDDAEELKATKGYRGGTSDLLFGDLKKRFVTRTEKHSNGIWEFVVPVERGFGEAWELVE